MSKYARFMLRSLYVSMAGLVFVSSTQIAAAQQAVAETTASTASAGIDDIVVTARRRAESVQDVPLAVSALGASAIEKAGITSVQDLARVIPNVTMTQFNIGEPQTYIRGVGSQTDSAASEASVTVSVDDVAIGRGGAPAVAFLDVGRVEVLRGPQGTL